MSIGKKGFDVKLRAIRKLNSVTEKEKKIRGCIECNAIVLCICVVYRMIFRLSSTRSVGIIPLSHRRPVK